MTTYDRAIPPLQVTTRAQERFATLLALLAGYIDAYAIVRYKTYVSFMSGNTTQVGSLSGQGDFATAVPLLLAVICFVLGVFCGTLLAYYGARYLHRLLFGLIAALLTAVISITVLSPLSSVLNIALLSLAMGLMNTSLSNVGAQSVNLVFVTGTLNRMAKHLALAAVHAPLPDSQGSWDTQHRRALLLFGIWLSFLIGAILGGFATVQFGGGVLLFPALIVTGIAALDYTPA